jgi:hypothetical protein
VSPLVGRPTGPSSALRRTHGALGSCITRGHRPRTLGRSNRARWTLWAPSAAYRFVPVDVGPAEPPARASGRSAGRLSPVLVIYLMDQNCLLPSRCHGPPTGPRASPYATAIPRFPATSHALEWTRTTTGR